MKTLIAFTIPFCIASVLAVLLFDSITAYNRLSDKTQQLELDKNELKYEKVQLEKDKLEQFYRGVYEVCMVVNGSQPDCLGLSRAAIEEDFYHDSAGGWKYPIDNSE